MLTFLRDRKHTIALKSRTLNASMTHIANKHLDRVWKQIDAGAQDQILSSEAVPATVLWLTIHDTLETLAEYKLKPVTSPKGKFATKINHSLRQKATRECTLPVTDNTPDMDGTPVQMYSTEKDHDTEGAGIAASSAHSSILPRTLTYTEDAHASVPQQSNIPTCAADSITSEEENDCKVLQQTLKAAQADRDLWKKRALQSEMDKDMAQRRAEGFHRRLLERICQVNVGALPAEVTSVITAEEYVRTKPRKLHHSERNTRI